MEVVVPTANDFHFDSTASSPYVSAPSSPKRFGDPFDCCCYHYSSAPTSPSRVAAIFASSSGWEEEEESSDAAAAAADLDDDFAFDFSGQLEKGVPPPGLTTADELFEKGKIRPLNLRLDDTKAAGVASTTPRPPRSEGTAAMVEERGRERGPSSSQVSSSSRSRKGSRSLSPMRSGGAGGFFPKSSNTPKEEEAAAAATSSRKWRLRDLLLFRSASEGRVTGNKSKDPLRKYTIISSSSLFSPSPKTKPGKGGEDSRTSSFRSTDSGGGSMRRGSGAAVSPHEMHYMSNRAASEEMKKKTALPFNHRQGLFGCLRFNPAARSIAKGFQNTYSFGRRQSKLF